MVHYLAYAAIVAAYCTPLQALVFVFVSQTFSGLLLAVAFGLGHNGMATIDADKRYGFAQWQV